MVPGYAGDSDLTSLAYAFEGAPNVRFDYAYDGSGYLTGQIIVNADWRWSPATSLAGYQTASYTAYRLAQYTAVTGQAYQYDANGNLTCISAAADCATYGSDFQYSAENQLLYARLADA